MASTAARSAKQSATPVQGDLLDILNNPERVSEADLADAHRLMKKWYAGSYAVWVENQEMAAWLKAQGIEVEA